MRHRLFAAVQVAILALVLGAMAMVAAQSRASAGVGAVRSAYAAYSPYKPQSPAVPLDPVTTGFTYQGRLELGGLPANGQYDLRFTLFDALAGGNELSAPITLTNQTISNGLFTVELDFGAAFKGDVSYVEIAVRPTGGGPITVLVPRQPVTPAPYATSLVPGAVISGTSGSALLTVNNNITAVAPDRPGADMGAAVMGNSISGLGLGGASDGGTGVYGESNTSWGMYGVTNSTSGNGASGVYGLNTGTGHGVVGETNDPGSAAVFGKNTGGGYGVYGSSSGNAGYFRGNLYVTGDVSKEYIVGVAERAVPVAYASIDSTGGATTGTSNVNSVWNAALSRYEITITGEDYVSSDFVTIVTVADTGAPAIAQTTDASNKLVVKIYNLSGSPIQRAFQFVTYRP